MSCYANVSTLAGSGTAGFSDGQGSDARFNEPFGVAIDSSENIYVADRGNHRICKITYDGVVSTFAGSGTAGFFDGQGSDAQFNNPHRVAVDSSGDIYVADTFNHRIRKITYDGVVSTFAGSGTVGSVNGQGSDARFNEPRGVAIDSGGNVYVADTRNNKIRKITPDGVVSTFAGSATAGAANGSGSAAQFKFPCGIAVDSDDNVYVADTQNHRIRKITPLGTVTTFAGSSYGHVDARGTNARFFYPFGVTVDSSGNVYVADGYNQRIRKITSDGVVSTLAGDAIRGSADGQGTDARFYTPYSVAVDSSGNVYVADGYNHKIRKITCTPCSEPVGTQYVTALCTPKSDTAFSNAPTCTGGQFFTGFNAGSSIAVGSSGTCTQCSEPVGTQYITALCTPTSDTVFSNCSEPTGTQYVTDLCTSTSDTVFSNAPNCTGGQFLIGFNAGSPTSTGSPGTCNMCPAGKWYNRTLLQCNTCPSGTFYVGPGATSMSDCVSCGTGTYSGIGSPSCLKCPVGTSFSGSRGTSSAVCTPCPAGQYSNIMGSATCSVCPAGTMSDVGSSFCYRATGGFIEDGGLYIMHAFVSTGQFITLGNIDIYDELVITATKVYSKGPRTLASATYTVNPIQSTTGLLDRGSVYTTDYGVFQSGTPMYIIVYLKTPCPATTPNWDPFQKKCVAACSFSSTSSICTNCPTINKVRSLPYMNNVAQFNLPLDVTVDSNGNVYVADTYNNKIRKITPDEVVSTFAGSGTAGTANGQGSAAQFYNPRGIAVDSGGNVYVTEYGANQIRKITSDGLVSELAAADSGFNAPRGITVDSSGNVYVADRLNNRIRKITPSGLVSTLAGSATAGSLDGQGTAAQFNTPHGVAVDSGGNFYVSDSGNHRIRKITPAGVVTTLAGSGSGFADGQGSAAQFYSPRGIAVDSGGNVYVADSGNNRIRKITSAGVVTTLAGSATSGSLDGQGSAAQFKTPYGITVDSGGNVYVADTYNNKIRKITPSGLVSTIVLTGNFCESGFTLSGTTCNGTSLTCPDQSWTLSGSLCTKTELICPTGSISMPLNYCLFSNGLSALQTSVDLIQSATSTPVSKPAYGACVTDCPVNSYKSEDCVRCPGNQVTTSAGATSVTACVCPVGTYGTNGSGVCTPCGQDQTSPQGTETQSGCVMYCPVGSYASSTSTCTVCPYGSSPAGSMSVSACVCAPGTFLNAGSCVSQCPAGMYKDNGTSTCIQCPGTQTSALGAVGISACVCPDGSGGLNGSGVCTPCTGGQKSVLSYYTCPDNTWTLAGLVCSKVSDYDCAGVSYDDLIESGQLLEPVEIDIGTTTQRSFTKQPTGVSSVFTFSLDLQIQNNTSNYRHIFQNIPGINWPIDNSDKGKPLLVLYDRSIWLRYSTNPGGPPSDYNFAIGSNFVPGDWFKCTCTVDGPNKTITMYINGVKQSQQTVIGGNLIAPTAAPSFTWRSQPGDINNGYMKVKNVYWWNQVLPSDAIKLFAGLSVPGACYKTANTCYSTTYTCPTSACVLNRYTCPDASWTLNGSVCLKPGQNMTAPTVTCSCPVNPPQYTCPAGWTFDSTNGPQCKRFSYYSCDNGGSAYDRDQFTGWTTVKSAWKLEGDRCKRYMCSADTSQSGTYITIDGNSCNLYNTVSRFCPTNYIPLPSNFSPSPILKLFSVCVNQAWYTSYKTYDRWWRTDINPIFTEAYADSTLLTTTIVDDIDATKQYDYIPADPVLSDQTVTGTLTRAQAKVMAIQTTSATAGSEVGRQCRCDGTQYMDLVNKTCVTVCPAGTYEDFPTGTCQPCPANMTSPEGSGSIYRCKCSYATPYWTGFSCIQELNPSAVVTGSGFTTRYENKYTIHEFTQSGSFTLLSPIIANILVVGGGAAGSYEGKPGGGGVVNFKTDQSLPGGEYYTSIGQGGIPNNDTGGYTDGNYSYMHNTQWYLINAAGGTTQNNMNSLQAFRFIKTFTNAYVFCPCTNSTCIEPEIPITEYDIFSDSVNTNGYSYFGVAEGEIEKMDGFNTYPDPIPRTCADRCNSLSTCVGFVYTGLLHGCVLYNYDFPVTPVTPDQSGFKFSVYKKK